MLLGNQHNLMHNYNVTHKKRNVRVQTSNQEKNTQEHLREYALFMHVFKFGMLIMHNNGTGSTVLTTSSVIRVYYSQKTYQKHASDFDSPPPQS